MLTDREEADKLFNLLSNLNSLTYTDYKYVNNDRMYYSNSRILTIEFTINKLYNLEDINTSSDKSASISIKQSVF